MIVDTEEVSMAAQVASDSEQDTEAVRQSASLLSPQLKAMIKIKKKYLKKKRAEQVFSSARLGHNASSDNIKSDGSLPPKRFKRKSKRRVMFPNDTLMFKPKKERSRAKPFLIFFSVVIFVQVYNAIENLDDHVLKYDLEGLERTLHREVFGQREPLEELMDHLKDYLSTYTHQQPLALSLHGATGVGKSHLGRLLARHFRSMIGEKLVVQYFSKHHCPPQEAAQHCASKLATRIAEVVTEAEEEDKIPFFILDEMELMQTTQLDVLKALLQPDQTNEFLNVVYVFLSSLGQKEITAHVLQNASVAGANKSLRQALSVLHPLWREPALEMIALSLLERGHVIQCFVEEMTLEGFYSDITQVEILADELAYHRAAGKLYAKTGCKQVVVKVNLL